MHHHVFSPATLVRMFNRLGMITLTLAIERPEHFIGFAQKTTQADQEQVQSNNLGFLTGNADWSKQDPWFKRERIPLIL